jgi:hypothetical protein
MIKSGPGIGIGVEQGAVIGGYDDDRIGRLRADRIHHASDIGVQLHQRVRVVAEMRFPGKRRRRIGRIVHLDIVDVHEERLGVSRVLIDIGNCRVGLPDVECREGVVPTPTLVAG